MNKESKEKIKKLRQEGKYDEIFAEFGSREYVNNTPISIRKAELKKLKKNGRYEDIFNKYGKYEYNKILVKAMFDEIREAKGLGKALLWRLKRFAIRGTSLSLATAATLSLGFSMANQDLVNENAITYAKEIENYNEKIDDYASKVKAMKLSDIQIFMKVMDDMWKGIKGYKQPARDIHGFLELELADEDGYGVCRNMASDIARKLQEINPDYNARTITVYLEEGFKIADIERNVIEDNETIQESNDEQTENSSDFDITKITGNHMVTLVDIKDENLTLALDPTNPGIGIYKDGNILMLNTTDGNLVKYDTKEIVTTLFFRTGFDAPFKSISDFISSFKDSSMSLDEIIAKYGLEAQNKALTEVRALEIAGSAINQLQANKEENDFEKRIKVDVSQLKDSDSQNSTQIEQQKADLERKDTEQEIDK